MVITGDVGTDLDIVVLRRKEESGPWTGQRRTRKTTRKEAIVLRFTTRNPEPRLGTKKERKE